jgi:hypothetical protein
MVASRRAPGSTAVEDFQRALAGSRATGAGVPRVRRHVRSLTKASGYRCRDPIYDAVAELWFDDEQAARAALASDAFAALRDALGADGAFHPLGAGGFLSTCGRHLDASLDDDVATAIAGARGLMVPVTRQTRNVTARTGGRYSTGLFRLDGAGEE